jgi:hypothetical protein
VSTKTGQSQVHISSQCRWDATTSSPTAGLIDLTAAALAAYFDLQSLSRRFALKPHRGFWNQNAARGDPDGFDFIG